MNPAPMAIGSVGLEIAAIDVEKKIIDSINDAIKEKDNDNRSRNSTDSDRVTTFSVLPNYDNLVQSRDEISSISTSLSEEPAPMDGSTLPDDSHHQGKQDNCQMWLESPHLSQALESGAKADDDGEASKIASEEKTEWLFKNKPKDTVKGNRREAAGLLEYPSKIYGEYKEVLYILVVTAFIAGYTQIFDE